MLIKRYGNPDVFQMGEIPTPIPKENEVLVKVMGSSVNPVDTSIRAGMLKSFVRLKLPSVLGVDFSGKVVETGRKVKNFKRNDTVYAFVGIQKNGGYGEYIAVPEEMLAHTPKSLGMVEAGVVPGVGMTAYEGLVMLAKINKGEKLLINGAGGGVGTFAIQVARALGAQVTAVCSTEKVALVKSLGADRVIDYKKEDLTDIDERFDVIFNCVRGASTSRLKKLLKPTGRILIITGNPFTAVLTKFSNLFSQKKVIEFFVQPKGEILQGLTKMIDNNKVKPIIEKTFSWKDLAEAHELVERGHVAGKIAIEIN